jgi:hypothetical protein
MALRQFKTRSIRIEKKIQKKSNKKGFWKTLDAVDNLFIKKREQSLYYLSNTKALLKNKLTILFILHLYLNPNLFRVNIEFNYHYYSQTK